MSAGRLVLLPRANAWRTGLVDAPPVDVQERERREKEARVVAARVGIRFGVGTDAAVDVLAALGIEVTS